MGKRALLVKVGACEFIGESEVDQSKRLEFGVWRIFGLLECALKVE